MMQSTSKASPSKRKNLVRFILVTILLLSTSLGSFFALKHLGVQDQAAKTLVALIVYPVLGLALWLGGFGLLGVDSRHKRIIGVLICLAFFAKPAVTLGFQGLGTSQQAASTIGLGVWLVAMLDDDFINF